jgi:CDP-diacylglycerol--glycerol-3-phosphate 3-phosphatidyltransferase
VKADASVYEGKRMIRRALERVPGLEHVDPNVVTVSILLPGVIAALALWLGLWIVAAAAIAARMVLATLDGFVAERYGRVTRLGSYLNRIVTEISDALVLLGLFPHAEPLWVTATIALAWLVNVAGVLGPAAGGAIQWTGPAGQADRLAILLVASLVAAVVPIEWTVVCALIVVLSAITIVRRTSRSIAELH